MFYGTRRAAVCPGEKHLAVHFESNVKALLVHGSAMHGGSERDATCYSAPDGMNMTFHTR